MFLYALYDLKLSTKYQNIFCNVFYNISFFLPRCISFHIFFQYSYHFLVLRNNKKFHHHRPQRRPHRPPQRPPPPGVFSTSYSAPAIVIYVYWVG